MMARSVVAVATVIGLMAGALAMGATGTARTVAAVVSFYGAFVVVVAGGPGRRPVLRAALVVVHRRPH